MSKQHYILFIFTFYFIVEGILCATNVYFQNNTPYNLTFKFSQIGELDSSKFGFHLDEVHTGQRVKLAWFTRSSGLKSGKIYLFSEQIEVPNFGLLKFEQRVEGTTLRSKLYHRLGGEFDHAWRNDRNTYNATKGDFIVFYRSYFSGIDDDIEYIFYEKHTPLIHKNAVNINAFNLFMRPRNVFQDGQWIRSGLIPEYLRGHDIVIFSEAFDAECRARLIKGIENIGLIYYTDNVGKKGTFAQDGGVFIASRFPILYNTSITFGPRMCKGSDCLSDKGIMYVKIKIPNGKMLHVFGTHTQANREHRDVRFEQIRFMRKWMDSFNISKDEIVVVGGDFNIEKDDNAECMITKYDDFLINTLRVAAPKYKGHHKTFDPLINKMAVGHRKFLDYVLFSIDHPHPTEDSFHETILLRSMYPWKQFTWQSNNWELSDHFPVYAHLRWEDKK